MEECTNVKGRGGRGATGELHLAYEAFSLLSSGASLEDLAAWSSPAAAATAITTQIPVLVHSCTVHITSAAPSYSPTTAPPCRPAIA